MFLGGSNASPNTSLTGQEELLRVGDLVTLVPQIGWCYLVT